MESIKNPKVSQLPEEGIEVLHQQTISWLNQIAFWKKENSFFRYLLAGKLFPHLSFQNKRMIHEILDKVSDTELDELNKSVCNHERFISDVLRDKGRNDSNYRGNQKQLLQQFTDMDDSIRSLKKTLFGLVKTVNENLSYGNEILNTIKDRRSVRKYKNKTVDRLHIGQLVAAAAQAPSAMNRQPWEFYVLTDPRRISLYSKHIAAVADKASHKLALDHSKENDPVFHGAPVVIFITTPRDNVWGAIDTGMCAQNLMLAASAMGFDSCPVGIAWFIENTSVYTELNIPVSKQIQIAITIGYGDEQPVPPEKKHLQIKYL
jgi:nitroreductase